MVSDFFLIWTPKFPNPKFEYQFWYPQNDFQNFVSFRSKHISNPCISYYNINSLRNKFVEITDLASKVLPDILVLAETKIDKHFKDSEFILDGYYRPLRNDFSSSSGGLIQYVRNGIIHSHKPEFELSNFVTFEIISP